jgi:hypothetical protein
MNVSVRGDIPPTIISKGLHLFDDVLKPVFIEKYKTYQNSLLENDEPVNKKASSKKKPVC